MKPRAEKSREGCKARVKTVSRTLGWNLQYEGLTPTNQFLDGNAGQPMAKVVAAAVYTLSCREIRGIRRHCSLLAGAAVSRNMRCIDGRKRDIQRPSARALALPLQKRRSFHRSYPLLRIRLLDVSFTFPSTTRMRLNQLNNSPPPTSVGSGTDLVEESHECHSALFGNTGEGP